MRDPIRLVRRFDEELTNLANVIALRVVSLGSHQFSCVKHGLLHSTDHKKARMPESFGCGRSYREIECALAVDELLQLRPAEMPLALTGRHPQTPSCCMSRCERHASAGARVGFLARIHRKN